VPRASVTEYLDYFSRYWRDHACVFQRGYRTVRWSYGDLLSYSERFAALLEERGIGKGDRVMLWGANCGEWLAAFWGTLLRGAVVVPMDRTSSSEFAARVYEQVDARLLVSSRGLALASLSSTLYFEDFASLPSSRSRAPIVSSREDAVQIVFTSGTTGEPKGVIHTSNSLIGCNKALTERFGLDASDVLLVASPVGHMTGYAAIVLLSVYLGGTMVLQDVWEPKRGVSLMAREGVTYTAASTPFLTDICDAVKAGAPRPASLRSFLCGGAPIPSMLIERAASELGIKVCSLWGMTEVLSGTLTEPSRASEKSPTTDGRPLDGMEVRVVDFDGKAVPTGQSGRLLVRGCQMFIGYYKKPELKTFDAEGWFDSGDLAYMDDEGYIRISGRVKDVLIRGGENVPVVEIENLLYKHPAVAAVAVVGYPDARLGERGCAFIVPKQGGTIDLAAMQAYLAECRMAKQFWPERVELVADLPRTATGKIQKFKLKEVAQAFGDGK